MNWIQWIGGQMIGPIDEIGEAFLPQADGVTDWAVTMI